MNKYCFQHPGRHFVHYFFAAASSHLTSPLFPISMWHGGILVATDRRRLQIESRTDLHLSGAARYAPGGQHGHLSGACFRRREGDDGFIADKTTQNTDTCCFKCIMCVEHYSWVNMHQGPHSSPKKTSHHTTRVFFVFRNWFTFLYCSFSLAFCLSHRNAGFCTVRCPCVVSPGSFRPISNSSHMLSPSMPFV